MQRKTEIIAATMQLLFSATYAAVSLYYAVGSGPDVQEDCL